MTGLYLGLGSLVAGNGGISRVSRLTARVVADEVAAGRLPSASACLLQDDTNHAPSALTTHLCRNSKVAFAVRSCLGKLTHSHAAYDFVGLANAHQLLPLPSRPYLTWIHGIEVWPPWTRPKYIRAARRARCLVSNSAYTRERAGETHPFFRSAVVCWLATEEDHPPPTATPAGPPRVTIIGRLSEDYKGHSELIDAWPAVRSAVPDAVLTVIGSGPALEGFREQAVRRGLSDEAVEFRGFVPEADMTKVWASTHVFAMPSRGEGFGLVYIEAMRQGRPVVGSVHDAAVEVNVDGQTGYNVNLDRPRELGERLIHLLRHPDLCQRLGEQGRERWATHFRYSAFRERFTPILRRFLADEPQ